VRGGLDRFAELIPGISITEIRSATCRLVGLTLQGLWLQAIELKDYTTYSSCDFDQIMP
jgi:hypothetical protein